ncbi:MAG: hypothetical protein FJ009_10295 [Chloroflexi bacterium]|nr:hypothetical protein [Chloroflexota bacterium]
MSDARLFGEGESGSAGARENPPPLPLSHSPALVLTLITFALAAVACHAAPTVAPTPTPRLTTVEGGIAEIKFDARALVLDQRAAPYYTIQLNEDTALVGNNQQPISLLDLRNGDIVRAEGQPTGRDAFRAVKLTQVRATPRGIASPTPSATPPLAPTPRATPPVLAGERIPLPGTLLIADTANNRVIEVNADKKIVWEFTPSSDQKFAAPSHAFFTPGFKSVVVTQSPNHQIIELDYTTRQIIWTFGEWGVAGADGAHLNTPDSARRLPDGRTIVADVRNCRVAIISLAQKIAAQIGKTGQCKNETGLLAKPNGVTLLSNGNLLLTEATNRRVSEVDLQGKVVRAITLPVVVYPSDAQLTRAGNILVAAYEKPGRLLEVDWDAQIVWEYFPRAETERLDRPSIALELPNGNIAFSDDYNDRVAIVNRAGKILWQYGVTGVAGKAPGYLNTPNGIDFRAVPIPAATLTAIAPTPTRTATPVATETVTR